MNVINYVAIFVIILGIAFIMLNKDAPPSPSKIEGFNDEHDHDIEHKNVLSNGASANKLDPISNPRYNMQQVIKQSILLEEHLSNRRKRCRDCIAKHFNHIIGLSEEAVLLSTNKPNDYCPHMKESVDFYNETFKEWLDCYKNKDEHNEECMKVIGDKLRTHRKKLIGSYFFDEKKGGASAPVPIKQSLTPEEQTRSDLVIEKFGNIPIGYGLKFGALY